MGAREALSLTTAEQLPGTVGAYLATPAGVNPLKAAAWTAACLAVLLAFVDALVWLSGGVFDVAMGKVRLFTTPDLSAYVVPLLVAAAVCLVAYVVLTLGSAVIGANNETDLRSEARHGVLRMMIDHARFGVEKQTPLVSVGLRCNALRGTFGGGVEVYAKKYQFSDNDFLGAKPSDFGGCDMLVRNGRLYVFANQQAKERWLKSRG